MSRLYSGFPYDEESAERESRFAHRAARLAIGGRCSHPAFKAWPIVVFAAPAPRSEDAAARISRKVST